MDFRFNCRMCGDCCRKHGLYPVTSGDLIRLSEGLGISPIEVFHKYCIITTHDGRRGMFINGLDGCCPFLSENLCSVHECRPMVCRVFPDPDGYVTGKRLKEGLKVTSISGGLERCAALDIPDEALLDGDMEATARFHIAEDTDRQYFATHDSIASIEPLACITEIRLGDALSLVKEKYSILRDYHAGVSSDISDLAEIERRILHAYSLSAVSAGRTLNIKGVRAVPVDGLPGILLYCEDDVSGDMERCTFLYRRYGDSGVFSITLLSYDTAYVGSFIMYTPFLDEIVKEGRLRLMIKSGDIIIVCKKCSEGMP